MTGRRRGGYLGGNTITMELPNKSRTRKVRKVKQWLKSYNASNGG